MKIELPPPSPLFRLAPITASAPVEGFESWFRSLSLTTLGTILRRLPTYTQGYTAPPVQTIAKQRPAEGVDKTQPTFEMVADGTHLIPQDPIVGTTAASVGLVLGGPPDLLPTLTRQLTVATTDSRGTNPDAPQK